MRGFRVIIFFPQSVQTSRKIYFKFQELRARISGLSSTLQELGVIGDQLKETVSVQDGKAISQRLWLLTQRQADVEHQLTVLMHQLEERVELCHVFLARAARFLTWGHDLLVKFESNLMGSTATPCLLDSESRIKRLESETKAEINLKARELSWLQATGNSINDTSDASLEVKHRLEQVNELWDRLNSLSTIRLEKKTKIMRTKDELTRRLEELRVWLLGVETSLDAPLVLERGSKKAVDRLLKDHEQLNLSIQAQSPNFGEVLNLCDMLLQDPTVDALGIETGDFQTAVQTVERRYGFASKFHKCLNFPFF